MTELYIVVEGDYKLVELTGDEEVNLNFNLQDLQSIQSRFANYSKEISLPSTSSNDKLFGFLFNISSSGNFEYNRQYPALLLSNGVPIFTGVLELDNISFNETHVHYYNILLLSRTQSLKKQTEGKTLADVDIPLATNIDEEYVKDLVTGSYPNEPVQFFPTRFNRNSSLQYQRVDFDFVEPAVYVKAIWDYIFQQQGLDYESNFLNGSQFKNLMLMTPNSDTKALSAKVLDFQVNTTITLDPGDYNNLGKTAYDVLDKLLGARLEVTTKYNSSPYKLMGYKPDNILVKHQTPSTISGQYTTISKVSQDLNTGIVQRENAYRWRRYQRKDEQPTHLGLDSPNNPEKISYYRLKQTKDYDINLDFSVEVFPDSNGTEDIKFQIVRIPNGKAFKERNQEVLAEEVINEPNPGGSITRNVVLEWSGLLRRNDIVFVQVLNPDERQKTGATTSNVGTINVVNIYDGSKWDITLKPTYLDTTIQNVSGLLTTEMSQDEFIDSIINLFNLQIQPLNEQKFRIEPYDEFYAGAEVKNWEDKIDYNSEMSLDFPASEQPSKVVYKYQHDDKDYMHQKYKAQNNNSLPFGSRTVNNPLTKDNDTKKVEIGFAAQPLYVLTYPSYTGSYGPAHAQEYLHTKGDVEFPFNIVKNESDVIPPNNNALKGGSFTPRIFFNNGAVEGETNVFISYDFPNTGQFGAAPNAVIMGSHLDNFSSPTLDLNFNSNLTYTVHNLPDKDAFIQFHETSLKQKIDTQNKVLTAYFYLDDIDIAAFSYNDFIFVMGEYFRVLEIKNYNLAGNFDSLTQVKLWKIGGSENIEIEEDDGDDPGGVITNPGLGDIPPVPPVDDPIGGGIPDDLPTTNNIQIDCNTQIEEFQAAQNLNLVVTNCECDGGNPTIFIPCSVMFAATSVSINIKASECPEVNIQLGDGCSFANGAQEAVATDGQVIFIANGQIFL